MSTSVSRSVQVTQESVLRNIGWDSIAEAVCAAFRMNEDEQDCFQHKAIAQLIAAIPFLAHCEDPERTAVTHLGAYLMSNRAPKKFYNTKPSDAEDVMKRLAMIGNFIGGDQKIIRRGMNLLALNMVADYQRDIEEDAELGKYNPVADGKFDYAAEKARLVAEIEAEPSPEMDVIMDVRGAIMQPWQCC